MALEQRNGRTYYYRSRRVNGRVRREYAGAGEAALMYAKWDEMDRDRRDLAAWERATLLRRADEALDAGAEFDRLAERVFHTAMHLTGHRQHKRGEWRRARGVEPMATIRDLGAPPQNPAKGDALDPKARAVLEGDGSPGAALARAFLSDPAQADALGALALGARAELIGMISARDPKGAVALARHCTEQTRGLLAESGPAPSLAEWMAAARAANNWLTVHALESLAAASAATGGPGGALDRRLTQAERRLHASLKSLAVLRRLRKPPVVAQVNIVENGPVVVNNGTGGSNA